MNLPEVKRLVQQHSLSELKEIEAILLNEGVSPIEILGEDEGECLTHVLSAIDILEAMSQGMEFKDAFRQFAQRVRTVIR